MIAERLLEAFSLDQFVFIPAFHAPHKPDLKPTSSYHRYAMLSLATCSTPKVAVSTMELEMPERPYSVETLATLNSRYPDDDVFFVMGADSWQDIRTWREWETVLSMTDHIVVTRPGYEISTAHVTAAIRSRIIDVRGRRSIEPAAYGKHIYFTDLVDADISATGIRRAIRAGSSDWQTMVPEQVAKYIEKYQIYR